MSRIRDVEGVPHWFAWLLHHWYARRCRKVGHVGTPVAGGCCTHCGRKWYAR